VAARYDIVTATENWVTVVASSENFDRLGQSTFAFARGAGRSIQQRIFYGLPLAVLFQQIIEGLDSQGV
jgi:hypothetical protein